MSTLSQHEQSSDVLLHDIIDSTTWQSCIDEDAQDPPIFPDDNLPVMIPENEHTLASRYAVMLDNHSQTEIFDLHNTVNNDHYATEIRHVLTEAFSLQDEDFKDTTQMIEHIAYNCNYSVENVTRVMNKQQYKMHRSFAEAYNIQTSRTVYHGTTQAGAKCIQAVGFKASAGRRAKFGRGIYTSPFVWEAIGYAKPYHDARQVFFVAEMLQGPTALGQEDQVDFGVDPMGAEILTLKNIDETILCSSKESQLLPTYCITVRYMLENPFILRHRECVKIVHADIANTIKHSMANTQAAAANGATAVPLPDAAAAALASTTSTALKLRLQYIAGLQKRLPAPTPSAPTLPAPTLPVAPPASVLHKSFKVGQKVRIKKTLKEYSEFIGKDGVIEHIVNASYYYFFVRLDDVNLRMSAQRINALPHNKARFYFLTTVQHDLVALKVDQIEACAKEDVLLGKRKVEQLN